MQLQDLSADSHAQLRDLYRALLENEEHYHEFKQLLARYDPKGKFRNDFLVANLYS